ncbi:ankyrin repeat and IBR domain-containing protein 1-like isoform X1 [Diorhabda sublineata]|uniref:ankyrin repeat and IBR domain-containing protein 1-like isoform X1 n=1 Tax=Diorhabda sublineata TaxID=1163346 RepID=UPI0024E0503B|nr:ankyrin repeat and IBR domain-containing protein 1-like isoform X1 [Diorhabda sublineata]
MGSTSSKFKKYIQHGDEYAAMQIYQSSPELKKNLDPNSSYGESHNHNTAMHYAAKHGMKHLLRAFLNDLGGNPNKRNGLNETALHSACQLEQTKSFSAQERRAACVHLLLYWKGVTLNNGVREKMDIAAQDKEGNTALHYAAQTGLKRCVELLLSHGATLFVENNDKLTPCDLAMRGSYHDIARLLESRMVFAGTAVVNEDELMGEQEVYSGLRSQDLQEAKDQLLVDTSDMLKVPLFTAEALLRNNEWSRELLLEKWMKDPVECCQQAGVQAPSFASQNSSSFDSSNSTDSNAADETEFLCEICLFTISNWHQPVQMSCKHTFCKTCWETYLTTKIQDGDAHHIFCPAFQCDILVPVELIEKLVTPNVARRYLQFDIKAFVESNKSIKWCPIPGCGRAVRLPDAERITNENLNKKNQCGTSHAVDCGNAHFFCWECLGEAHAPSGCKQWKEWQSKISEIKPEELKASCSGSEDAANCLWLVTNSKPCPSCKSPIQKNEGCNHMKCSKCKFDFCWVCQESWKRHSSATGGYFRCNRFEAVLKADEKQGSLIIDALDRNNQMQEMSRFLHFYTRFKNHENSRKLEEILLTSVKQKMEILVNSFGITKADENIDKGTKFIEDGVRELLKARRVLCGSYIYGYYLEDDGYNKTIFEFMQNELEEVTEKLSEMIARPYLRTPKSVIIQTSALARRKRHEFVRAVEQGLIPPETPPMLRKKKKKCLDSDLSQTSSWLKDCEWPEYDTDEETDMGVTHKTFPCTCKSPIKDNKLTKNCDKGSDYNMELIIALEMSRLQMIEDRMKQQAQQTLPAITPDPSSNTSNESSSDDQLKLAIQLSLQESTAAISRQLEFERLSREKSNAEKTVDYFLKSLANHSIDLRTIEKWKEHDNIHMNLPCSGNKDGTFQISDIHDNGYAFEDLDNYDCDVSLKRSHSTGDLCIRRSNRTCIRTNIEEPRYHLDSDHSSQHEDKPEDVVRRLMALPASVRNKQLFLLHTSYPEEDSQGQSSVEDTTTSDSINVDQESFNETVKVDGNDEKGTSKISECKKQTHNPFSLLKTKLCSSSHLPKTKVVGKNDVIEEKISTNQNTSKTDKTFEKSKQKEEDKKFIIISECKSEKQSPKKHHKTCKKNIFSKSTGFLVEEQQKATRGLSSNLRIQICDSPIPNAEYCLETDSSNEYESETGIPKSPTLFISGVSISRTPEPKSSGMSFIQTGRSSRSSSFSIPLPLSSCSLSISSTSLNNNSSLPPEPYTPSLIKSNTPISSRSNLHTPSTSPSRSNNETGKTRSANEPEREREMFRFPKSSTDGALSSVLHVQESNLSSDDFHEALFLLERTPQVRDSKRRKKSKKREKDDKKEDQSSVL